MPPSMDPKNRELRDAALERYADALKNFKEPTEEELVSRKDNSIRQHPAEGVEGYFEWVTRSGVPGLQWDVIRPAFLWKIKFVMDEMIRLERSRLPEGETLDFDDKSLLKLSYDFIMEKAAEFDGAPFTWQRICELLHTPSRHYKKAIKFLRALDKTINVVSTVDPSGRRLTGAKWTVPTNDNFKIENAFVGKVDEVDGTPDDDIWSWNLKELSDTTPTPKTEGTFGEDVKPETPRENPQAEPLDMSTRARKRESENSPSTHSGHQEMENGVEEPPPKRQRSIDYGSAGCEPMESSSSQPAPKSEPSEVNKPESEAMDTTEVAAEVGDHEIEASEVKEEKEGSLETEKQSLAECTSGDSEAVK